MLYRLEQRVEGVWRLVKEVTNWGSWDEVARHGAGSFRLVHPKTGVAEREFHLR